MDPRRDIIRICSRLYQRALIAGRDGNVSLRLTDRILITAAGCHKGFLEPEQFAELAFDGQVLSGSPSSEAAMHLAIYQHCPEARAVVHSHAPVATAWAVARQDLNGLPVDCLTETRLALGEVPFVPYARPGTPALGQALVPFLPAARALILKHHGCVTWAESLEQAFCLTEHLEHAAQTLMAAHSLGGCHPLAADYLEELR